MKKLFVVLFLLLASQISYSQWVQSNNGLSGGTVNALFSKSGDLVFAATEGGVYVSTDKGYSWKPPQLPGIAFYSFASMGSSAYAGSDYGVYFSSDNGVSWKPTAMNYSTVGALAMNQDYIYAGCYSGGVYRSSDNGTSWAQMNNGLMQPTVQALAISGNRVYAGTAAGVYYSTNDGFNWTKMTTGPSAAPDVNAIAVDGSTIYVCSKTGVLKSTDDGQNWSQKNSGLTSLNIRSIVVNGANVYVATDNGVYHSNNGGDVWTLKNTGMLGSKIRSLIQIGANHYLAGAEGSGVFASINGAATWAESSTGMANISVPALAKKGETLVAGLKSLGAYVSGDGGENWDPSGLSRTTINALTVGDGKFLAATNDGVFVSTDGVAWDEKNAGLTNKDAKAIAFDGGNIYLGTTPLNVSTDMGESWISTDLNQKFSAILAKGERTIAGASDGHGIFVSDDYCTTWGAMNEGLGNLSVNCIASVNDKIYVGTENGLFASTDNCESWSAQDAGITNKKILSILAFQQYVLAGTRGGMFLSTDNGGTWKAINDGLTFGAVGSMVIDGDYLIIGTLGGGLYKGKLSDFGIIKSASDPKSEESLRVFPNPATDFINISSENKLLAGEAQIFDALGAIVAKAELSGASLSRINVSLLSPGVYCIRVGDEIRVFIKK